MHIYHVNTFTPTRITAVVTHTAVRGIRFSKPSLVLLFAYKVMLEVKEGDARS